MNNDGDKIVNVVPPFAPKTTISSWRDFEKQFTEYMEKNNLKFRVRSSERTESYNKTHQDQIPVTFEYSQRIYRCTHGVSQKSRSKGHLNRKQRYCKCSARLTVIVCRVLGNHYEIVLRNQNHTHSHSNSETQASSYLTTATLPLDNQNLEGVKTLTDARVSSTHITNFLNDRIGCKVTPQQTRNLIRIIMGQDSAQDRMKDLLHALRQLDGSDVLVIQDQLDITCGVIMQTKVQKMMFDRWGENLTMDFTHSTNNLGYHLGEYAKATILIEVWSSLRVRAEVSLYSILKYFKEKNPEWKDVKSVVIDKDFLEWQVLEQTFPNAQIVLCQFHATTYWKKVVKRKEFRLRVADREDLLDLMTKLLYCRTQDAYQSGYYALKENCRAARKSAFFAYFKKNWHSCRIMWSNYTRGKHFTAGNTTTNRIESNWKYLKMLLGLKTRIDKTLAGLLQHQMIITRQIVSAIEKQHSSSRLPKTVPSFLRAVARRLSPYMLEKVKNEWEGFVNGKERTTCMHEKPVSKWKVYYSHQVYECDDVDWTCTCLFYSSHHLPCYHLMHVVSEGHGFQILPGISVHERWSAFEALDVKDELTSAANALQPIVNMSKLKLPKRIRLPDSSDQSAEERKSHTSSDDKREVVYIRLRRDERAKQVVLTSAEKYSYAKAMLDPLLKHLSELSTADFYQELKAWKETVEVGLSRREAATANTRDIGDNDDDEAEAELQCSYAIALCIGDNGDDDDVAM
ncbi:hypothetical protein PPTG_04307 [Phytophthora nicotianae INRA-310]|uniref:SWIM-type domain-containing protein n=1 Tax=Phytophthora nicotianae (strain INRA-310) TaxID=761204 RepID=W2R0H7_PHYN3|nr:hypothetical protein PPTG_04307 [Phytophthora nicotianae INRA-310]ETN18833.1 hypothetical protein PPTG_04307 [Phytophthora nicotianae INRA-310]